MKVPRARLLSSYDLSNVRRKGQALAYLSTSSTTPITLRNPSSRIYRGDTANIHGSMKSRAHRKQPRGGSRPPSGAEPSTVPGLHQLNQSTLARQNPYQSSASENPSNQSGEYINQHNDRSEHKHPLRAPAQRVEAGPQEASRQPGKLQDTDTPATGSTRAPYETAREKRNGRAPPSAASGGVPSVSAAYLRRANVSSVTNTFPRRILVIIDLNGTLLHRPNKRRPFNFVQRPHAREFLAYCLETFHVAIWSSARPENVNKMITQLLTPEQVRRCILVWGRDRFGLDAADYDARVQCYKRLTRVWQDPAVQRSHPPGGQWDQTNTVLVDDSPEKGRSEPFNILSLPEFSGLSNEPPHVLPQVHDYLNTLCYQSNVSNFTQHKPFGLLPDYTLPIQS